MRDHVTLCEEMPQKSSDANYEVENNFRFQVVENYNYYWTEL